MRRISLLACLLVAVAAPLVAQAKSSPLPTPTPPPAKKDEAATPPLPEGAIARLRITLTTGGDDLREGSKVSAFLIAHDGRRLTSLPLNCSLKRLESGVVVTDLSRCHAIPNHTRRTFEWNLRDFQVIFPADVHRFGLQFASGNSGPFQTGDNWNLNRLEVEYMTVQGAPITTGSKKRGTTTARILPMLSTGGFVHRFKTVEEWESDPLRLGP